MEKVLLTGCGQHDGRSLQRHDDCKGAGCEGAGEDRGWERHPGGAGASEVKIKLRY